MSDELKRASQAVESLLNVLGVTSVICVDDYYGRSWSDDDLLEAQQALTEDELREIFGRPGDVFPDDRAVRQQSFREAWRAVEAGQRNHIATRVLTISARKTRDELSDAAAATALEEIVGPARFVKVEPKEWGQIKARIKENQAEGRTLLLFDQDLSDQGRERGGMVLVQDVLADEELGARVMCGLLTHTVTIANQQASTEELAAAATPPLDLDRFIVVAKGWLSQDPMGFARMLKLIALMPDCRAMKLKGKELLDQATAKAHDAIDRIHINDFESMVFRSAKEEGLWEPDMLFRLFGIYQRSAVRKLGYTDADLRSLSDRLRSVSEIPTDSPNSVPLSTWKVQREEIYEEGDYINQLHLPIEIGDIFVKTDGQSEKYYILLGQPCDLMVRSDGKRTPDACDVIIGEIFAADAAKPHSVPLPHFSADDPKKKFFVRLRPMNFVHPCVVDLCVYNKDGLSKIDLGAECPEGVLPAWKAKHAYMKKEASKLIRRYSEFGAGKIDNAAQAFAKSQAPKHFPLSTSNSGLFKASISNAAGTQVLSFNCKRVMRLQATRALAISMEYVHCLTRPAFERDLGA